MRSSRTLSLRHLTTCIYEHKCVFSRSASGWKLKHLRTFLRPSRLFPLNAKQMQRLTAECANHASTTICEWIRNVQGNRFAKCRDNKTMTVLGSWHTINANTITPAMFKAFLFLFAHCLSHWGSLLGLQFSVTWAWWRLSRKVRLTRRWENR